MCGISGIISKKNEPIKQDEIKVINDLISHRGPDDEGFYMGSNFAFGHRRLSILDLSKDGHQPMELKDFCISYNGEIYNYLELKQELQANGYSFKTKTDTEVILASYDFWGQECVNKFNGMWSFALYDKAKNIIFCSRDRFGVKPFYFTQNDDKFVFGSEIKQLLVFTKPVANQKILLDFLVTGFLEHTNETFFKDIFKLDSSSNLVYDLNTQSYEIYKYYEIKTSEKLANLDELKSIKEYEKKLKRAIELRLRSDVRVGTCLSGGLDSSSVASIAASLYDGSEKFKAIHAKSIEKATDESEFAKIVAKEANLDLNIVKPDSNEFKKYIDEVVYTQEEPFGGPSIFMQYFVMQKAKEIDCKVMLDGQGGDETLLGYERYYPAVYVDIFKKDGLLKAYEAMRESAKNNANLGFKKIILYSFGFLCSFVREKEYKKRAFFIEKNNLKFNFLQKMAKNFLSILSLQKYEITTSNLPRLLRYEDKNSMRHSIETRLPFIDYKTLETALSINSNFKIKNGWSKYILRKIIDKSLPKSVVWRKNKLGFNAPDNIWLKSIDMKAEIEKSSILNEICDFKKLNSNFDKINQNLKWRLYNVALWQRIYGVKIKGKK